MKRCYRSKRIILTLFAAAIGNGICGAQITGYVTGANSLTSFNASTGAIINTFGTGGDETQFAVASDDVTLYIPFKSVRTEAGSLNVISGTSGQMLNSVALPVRASKVILSKDGSTAYVLCSLTGNEGDIYVVDLATLVVTGSLIFPEFAPPVDLTLSPDAKHCTSPSRSLQAAHKDATREAFAFSTLRPLRLQDT